MSIPTLSEIAGRDRACVHASCVAVQGRGILIMGPSGAGKSALALQMMGLGAKLVADDQTELQMQGGRLTADAVPTIRGLIEARGIGLLRAESAGPVPVHFVVDLGQSDATRLPDPTDVQVLKQPVPLLRTADVPNLAPALTQLLKMGRVDPEWPNR